MSKIKYVSLEPAAFLSDVDFIAMYADQRGVYITLILFLYCNNGRLRVPPDSEDKDAPDAEYVRVMCNAIDPEGDVPLDLVFSKFEYDGEFLTHKRVTKELRKSADFVAAGKKGADKRWNSPPNGLP
jgi:uncharacterized protein YdaU (DUF1376 family)